MQHPRHTRPMRGTLKMQAMKWTVLIHGVRIVNVVTVDKLLIHLNGRRGFLLRSGAVNGKMPAWRFTWFVLSNGVIWRWPPWCQPVLNQHHRGIKEAILQFTSQDVKSTFWVFASLEATLLKNTFENSLLPFRVKSHTFQGIPPACPGVPSKLGTRKWSRHDGGERRRPPTEQPEKKLFSYQKQVSIQPLCHCVLHYEIALLVHCGNDTKLIPCFVAVYC